MCGGKICSTHEGFGATPLGEGSRSKHSGYFSSFEGVGSLDTRSGSHSDERADADASHLPYGI